MEVLLLLLPLSFILVTIAVGIFVWAANNKQFENLDQSAIEALEDQPLELGETSNE